MALGRRHGEVGSFEAAAELPAHFTLAVRQATNTNKNPSRWAENQVRVSRVLRQRIGRRIPKAVCYYLATDIHIKLKIV